MTSVVDEVMDFQKKGTARAWEIPGGLVTAARSTVHGSPQSRPRTGHRRVKRDRGACSSFGTPRCHPQPVPAALQLSTEKRSNRPQELWALHLLPDLFHLYRGHSLPSHHYHYHDHPSV